MSMPEREVENKVEFPAKEEVERVSYCVGTYLSAFSKEPFDEKWSVNGEKSSAFLLNPKTTGEFVNEIFQQDEVDLFSLVDGGEMVKVNKGLVLKHIDETLSNEMTEYLSSTNWISENEMVELVKLRDDVEKTEENFVTVSIPYPLTEILNSYLTATENPTSMVLLGYQDASSLGSNDGVEFLRIQPGTEISHKVCPRVVCRYTTANSPKSEIKENAQDFVLKEIKHYLDDAQIKQVREILNPNSYTTFFGELAKIPDSDRSLKAIPVVGAEYIKIITSVSEGEQSFDFLDLISHQLVYLSVEGTSVLKKSNKEGGSTKLFEGVMNLLSSLGLKYREEILEFQNSKRQNVVIGVIKRIED